MADLSTGAILNVVIDLVLCRQSINSCLVIFSNNLHLKGKLFPKEILRCLLFVRISKFNGALIWLIFSVGTGGHLHAMTLAALHTSWDFV